MRFQYAQVDPAFVARILAENNRRLSRTHHGHSDVSTSPMKHPLLLSGQALVEQVQRNEQQVHRLIFERRDTPAPASGADVQRFLFEIADLTNDGLLPAGRFRLWEIPPNPAPKVPHQRLEQAVAGFCEEIHTRWKELETDPVPLAAWAEWELNAGSLHPFYDGCGRISRFFSAALLVSAGWLLPLFEDSAAYFSHANRGVASFQAYYRDRILACADWLERGSATSAGESRANP